MSPCPGQEQNVLQIVTPWFANRSSLSDTWLLCICPSPPFLFPPMFLPFGLSPSHYCYCREQSQGTILPRTLRSLISSFTDMALLTSPMALLPLGGLKCQLPLAERLKLYRI